MATWAEFAGDAPGLAQSGRQRMEALELVMLGTIKADGSPRISPVEPDFVEGELMMGMMWQSTKARDLMRDPRCVVHSVVSDRQGTEGEFKIVGEARAVSDPVKREQYCQVIEQRIGSRPEDEFHLFAIDIHRVWWFRYHDDQREEQRWTAPEDDSDVK